MTLEPRQKYNPPAASLFSSPSLGRDFVSSHPSPSKVKVLRIPVVTKAIK